MSRTVNVEQLEDAGLDRDEAHAVAVPQGDDVKPVSSASRVCTDYLHTTHPDTGLDVVFVPGETLPDWALAVQRQRDAPPAPEPLPQGRRPIKASKEKGEPKPE